MASPLSNQTVGGQRLGDGHRRGVWSRLHPGRRRSERLGAPRDDERHCKLGGDAPPTGLGEAALVLARDLGAHGELVGVDVSAEMVAAARAAAGATRCRTRFTVGDACALDEPDGHFDVVRSERTLQWLTDPAAAVGEMSRVVRPGGRISLIDTDWSTFTIDVGDDDLATRVREAMRTERGRPSNIGRRLDEVAREAGFTPLHRTAATHTWTSWNPDESPAPDGCFSMRSLADDLVDADLLDPTELEQFVSTIHRAARRDQFTMSLTMHAVVAAAS
jgi:SAM-dependent methyltransferase